MEQPSIRVGIMHSSIVEFNFKGEYHSAEVPAISGAKVFIKENKLCLATSSGLEYLSKSFKFVPDSKVNKPSFTLKDVPIGINFHWEQKRNLEYTGELILSLDNGLIRVINVIPLEDYLRSVISSEMSSKSSNNLLKAHAVISRSWLLAQVLKSKTLQKEIYSSIIEDEEQLVRWYDREDHIGFDVCADDHCQRYQGITDIITEKVDIAINETFGEFLVFENEICDARFSKCCGGVSEPFHTVWEPKKHSYLIPVADKANKQTYPDLTQESLAIDWINSKPEAFCNTDNEHILSMVLPSFDQKTQDFYRWEVQYTQEQISGLLSKYTGINFGEIIKLEVMERGPSARIIKLKIHGTKRTKTFGKELEIRRILSDSHLYSSAFHVEHENIQNSIPQTFILKGAGWGHGVGLCQIGAAVMGEKGYSYKQILEHYFSQAELKKLY